MNSFRGEEEIGSLVTSKNEYISIVKSLVINKFGKSVFFPMDLGLTKLKHVNCLLFFLLFYYSYCLLLCETFSWYFIICFKTGLFHD